MSLQNSKHLIAKECAEALERIDDRQGERLVDAIMKAGKVYFCGVDRVLLSLQEICKRLAHLGIDAHYVGKISEPAITDQDLLIIASGSGESVLPKTIAEKANHCLSRLCCFTKMQSRWRLPSGNIWKLIPSGSFMPIWSEVWHKNLERK